MNDHDHASHEHVHTQEQAEEPTDYPSWIEAQRRSKDEYFKGAHASPIPHDERDAFDGLAYYPIESDLRFEFLSLGPVPEGLEIETEVQTSDGKIRQGKRVGALGFEVDGQPHTLVGLRLAGADEGSLFVPFKDSTNGAESYGAGRYLDLAAQEDGTYDLDFNLAYAPFCAYSPTYSCPLPPPENWLTARITAGERNL
jgi:uncharacterized protein (DUF1684 family)